MSFVFEVWWEKEKRESIYWVCIHCGWIVTVAVAIWLVFRIPVSKVRK